MGSEPSGPIANLALAYKELKWVQAQVDAFGPLQISVQFNNFKGYARYIDDMGTSHIEIPTVHDYYDMPLIPTGSTSTSSSVEFLSFVFHKEHFLPITATIKDKQDSFPIQLLRYPGHMSTISNECKCGCVIAGLTTIFRCINSLDAFSTEIKRFFDRLRCRRFTFDIIRNGCKKIHQSQRETNVLISILVRFRSASPFLALPRRRFCDLRRPGRCNSQRTRRHLYF